MSTTSSGATMPKAAARALGGACVVLGAALAAAQVALLPSQVLVHSNGATAPSWAAALLVGALSVGGGAATLATRRANAAIVGGVGLLAGAISIVMNWPF